MTDKQIIVDGVDVSGCDFHSLSTMGYAGYNYCKCFQCVCECHKDCYYKQLKRKEQECEELKIYIESNEQQVKEVETLVMDNDRLINELAQLKAEIKLSKEMLIQNTSETNKYTIPQIIEQFISDNYIDQQDEDGYTIPIFIQLENILYEKEDLEEKLGFAETSKGLLNKEIQKLKQTLTEIKEFVENEMIPNCDTSIILQIISEAIPNEN